MKDLEHKSSALKEILDFASKLRGDKLKGKPMAMEVEITSMSEDDDEDSGMSKKDKLKKALGL